MRPEGTVNEAVQQVAFADRVLLNKLDLVDKGELGAVKTLIQEVNAFAELIECQQSRVPVDKLMDMCALSAAPGKRLEPAGATRPPLCE